MLLRTTHLALGFRAQVESRCGQLNHNSDAMVFRSITVAVEHLRSRARGTAQFQRNPDLIASDSPFLHATNTQ